jgi:hypothetical protein
VTDIVARLRIVAKGLQIDVVADLACEAADEIERLRKLLHAVADYSPEGLAAIDRYRTPDSRRE